jgi:hypothetical protein
MAPPIRKYEHAAVERVAPHLFLHNPVQPVQPFSQVDGFDSQPHPARSTET